MSRIFGRVSPGANRSQGAGRNLPSAATEPEALSGGNFPSTATESDILNCFRLLLGRWPSKQEWPGHVYRVGEDLATVVSTYLSSEEFAQRRLLNRPLEQWQVVELPHCKIYASAEDTFNGKVLSELGPYEPHLAEIFKKYLRPGMRVLDIGANIGYFSLLAASLVGPSGLVQGWEPSPENVKMLYASQLLSGFRNIEIIQAAATDCTGLLRYFRASSNGNVANLQTASIDDILSTQTVMGLRIDDFVSAGAQVSFIKVDVEGHEFRALSGAKNTIQRDKPVIVSELSADALPHGSGVSAEAYLEFLAGLGYDIFVITDAGPVPSSVRDALFQYQRSGTDHIDLLLLPKTLR